MGYARWIDIKAEVLKLRETFGDPRLRALAFEYKVDNQYLFIEPKCVVTKPPQNLIGLQIEQRSNISIESQDYFVRSVPRDFPVEAFKYRCWLDAVVKTNGKLSGIACRVHYVDDTKGLHYDLVLKRETEQKSFN